MERTDVVVVGAGMAGMLAAANVVAAGRSVAVVDARPPGGRARATVQDGFTLNLGPHAVYDGGALRRELAAVGVAPTGGAPLADAGGLRHAGVVVPFPTGARRLATTPLLGARGKLATAKLLGGLPRVDPARLVGRTVDEWLADLPADAAALVRVLVRVASYTDAPDLLDAGAAVRQVQLAMRGVTYVDGGWQWIVDQLVDRVLRGGGEVRRDEVLAVGRDGDDVVVQGADAVHAARAAVVATGGPAVVARLTGHEVPGAERLGPPAEAASLDVGTSEPPVVPVLFDVDRPLYWSVHSPVARLSPPGTWLGTALEYLRPGAPRPPHEIVEQRLEEHVRAAGVDPDRALLRRALRAMTVHHGVPLAREGGLGSRPAVDAVARIEATRDVFIAGDWVGPEGMIADAAAASARAAADASLAALAALEARDAPDRAAAARR
jgi:glycine/D-amino acid oxidase-like deaminating enzyme